MENNNPLNPTESNTIPQASTDVLVDFDVNSPNLIGAAALLVRWILETIQDAENAAEQNDAA